MNQGQHEMESDSYFPFFIPQHFFCISCFCFVLADTYSFDVFFFPTLQWIWGNMKWTQSSYFSCYILVKAIRYAPSNFFFFMLQFAYSSISSIVNELVCRNGQLSTVLQLSEHLNYGIVLAMQTLMRGRIFGL